MSDPAFLPERSAPSALRAAERRNTGAPRGTEQRNNPGTMSLEALMEQVISRAHTGTPSGTNGGTRPISPFRTPRNALCPHVTNLDLAAWYAAHPEAVCARCWLKGHPTPEVAHD